MQSHSAIACAMSAQVNRIVNRIEVAVFPHIRRLGVAPARGRG